MDVILKAIYDAKYSDTTGWDSVNKPNGAYIKNLNNIPLKILISLI